MNSQKFLGSFLSAIMIFSQVEGFTTDVSAKSDNSNNKLSTSAKIAMGVGAGAGVVGALSLILWKCLQDDGKVVNVGTDETDVPVSTQLDDSDGKVVNAVMDGTNVPVSKQLDDVDIVVNFDDWFDKEKNCVTGSRVDKFFKVHQLDRGHIQSQIVTDIRESFLTDKNSKNGHWSVENPQRKACYENNRVAFCENHIWIQYGLTEKDVISYAYLHKILHTYISSGSGGSSRTLLGFLQANREKVSVDFVEVLKKYEYNFLFGMIFNTIHDSAYSQSIDKRIEKAVALLKGDSNDSLSMINDEVIRKAFEYVANNKDKNVALLDICGGGNFQYQDPQLGISVYVNRVLCYDPGQKSYKYVKGDSEVQKYLGNTNLSYDHFKIGY